MAQTCPRHALAWISPPAWAALRQEAPDAVARECLDWWAAQRLPLVVTRQAPGDARLALGLAAPERWGRRKLAVRCDLDDVVAQGDFPAAAAAGPLLAPALQPAWRRLCADLQALGCTARVHGSHGWQLLSGLPHLREGSDLDLLLPVASGAQADAVTGLLQGWAWDGPRLDGELLLPGGAGVAWREWQALCEGRVAAVLAKRLEGVALESRAMALGGGRPEAAELADRASALQEGLE